MRRKCISVYVVNNNNTLKSRMEEHFRDVAQKVQYNKKLDNFSDNFAQHFDQKTDSTTVSWNNEIRNPLYSKTYWVY